MSRDDRSKTAAAAFSYGSGLSYSARVTNRDIGLTNCVLLFGLEAGRFGFQGGDICVEDVRDLHVRLAAHLPVAVFRAHNRRLVHADLERERGLIHPRALPEFHDYIPDVPLDLDHYRERGKGDRRCKRLNGFHLSCDEYTRKNSLVVNNRYV